MPQTTTAVYQDGKFLTIDPVLDIPENAVVRVTIEEAAALSAEEQLELLRSVPVAEELAAAIEEGRRRPWRVNEL